MKVDKSKWKKCILNQLLKEYSSKNKRLQYNNVFSVTNSEGFVKSTEYFDTKVFSNNLSTYKLVENGMFAYNPSRINVGSIALLESEERVIVSPLYVIFSVSKEIDSHFLLRFLKSPIGLNLIKSKTSGSVRNSLRFKDLISISITLPSLSEQQAIASELDAIQKIIEDYKAQLADLDVLAQSIFLDTFGDPISNPKGWEKVFFASLTKSINYGTSLPAVDGGKYKYIRMGNITDNGYMDFKDLKYINIPDSDLEKYMVHKGDILFNRTNSRDKVGKTACFMEDEPMIIAGYIIRVRLNELKALPSYIAIAFNTPKMKDFLKNLARGSVGQANINSKELSSIPIPLPPLILQQQFAEQVEAIEKQKDLLREQLKDAETLMAERMQYYFS